jgi:L-threonylcarbamoyladenylate synthase
MSNSPFISNCTADAIRDAALALKAGYLVAFPTETVYGLGADARNPEAIKRIYEVKGRPTGHPLIVHISSLNQLDKWAIDIPEYAIKLARKFWPGPMTLILKRSEIAGDFITGGQDTVGLRVPSDPIALALIAEFEKISNSAIAAPSANRFGQVSPTSSADVQEELGRYLGSADQILDGGNSSIGIESTIIDCTSDSPSILRKGAVTRSEIVAILGDIISTKSSSERKFSGSFDKHYSPLAEVILDVEPSGSDGYIALSTIPTPINVFRLSSPQDIEDFARSLYSSLRKADQSGIGRIVVAQPKGEGLAEAIRDRLAKAANGRLKIE